MKTAKGWRKVSDVCSEWQQRYADNYKPPTDPLALMSKAEVAALFGVKPVTIDAWRKKHWICPPVGLSPQTLRWRRQDIERLLIERQVAPAPTRNPHKAKGR